MNRPWQKEFLKYIHSKESDGALKSSECQTSVICSLILWCIKTGNNVPSIVCAFQRKWSRSKTLSFFKTRDFKVSDLEFRLPWNNRICMYFLIFFLYSFFLLKDFPAQRELSLHSKYFRSYEVLFHICTTELCNFIRIFKLSISILTLSLVLEASVMLCTQFMFFR